MKNKKLTITLISILLAVLLSVSLVISSCSAKEKSNKNPYYKKGGKNLSIATEALFPPFESINKKGEYTGFDIEMMYEVAKIAGYDGISINDMAFDSVIPYIEKNKDTVAVAAISITQERAEKVLFSNPYYQTNQTILAKKGQNPLGNIEGKSSEEIQELIKNKLNANEIKIIVVKGYASQAFLTDKVGLEEQDMSDTNKIITVINTPNGIQQLQIASDNTIYIVDKAPGTELVSRNEGKISVIVDSIGEESYGLAINKQNGELLNKMNEALNKLMKDTAKFNALKEKYGV